MAAGSSEKTLLIFDLDGTLIDSRLDLANSVNATLAEVGKEPLAHPLIYSFVGNGAPVLIRKAMGSDASDEEVQRALGFFLAYYRDHAVDETHLYPGVLESLEQLHAAGGIQLAVLTNKPVRISEAIMNAMGIDTMLFRVYGGNSFEQKKPHPVGIDALRAEADVAAERTWMVGDSIVDMKTARNAGVKSCGVTYGFQPETLYECPPDLLVDRIQDFAVHILTNRS